jgi:hypothetical protein
MREPKEGERYILVRVSGDRIEHAEYTRYADDSVYIVAEGYDTVIEFSPGAWGAAWEDLKARGFVEMREAQASGLLPAGWEPGGAG